MSEHLECILVLDDSVSYDEHIAALASPRYQVHYARTIQDAYWEYLEHPELYKLALLDFNLESNRARSNFDGIDLALIIDTFAKDRGLQTPWLIAFTTAEDDLLDCFFNLSTSAPLMDVIRKRGSTTVVKERLQSLFSALADDDPTQFHALPRKSAPRLKPKIKLDEETLARLCPTYQEKGKGYFNRLANIISKSLFSSYRSIEFSALAPGYSGSEILSVVAQRGDNLADSRTFVVKLCKEKTEASTKLKQEANNYLRHAKHIKDHVPLLVGPFEIKGWRFIAYEFVFIEGKGVSTFADYLRNAIENPNMTPDEFKQRFSSPHSDYIFEKILGRWHEAQSGDQVSPDTNLLYAKSDWFQPHLVEAKKRVIDVYGDIKTALNQNRPRLDLSDLNLGPQPLTLANPFYVINDRLLNKGGASYYEHFLSGGMIHGDLHSGNILRSLTLPIGRWMLIDFANVYETAHLAQDGTRLECDIKFQRIEYSLRPRFTMEVELARWLDIFLGKHLGKLLDMPHWAAEWQSLPNNYKLVECQIRDIRTITIKRIKERASHDSYSEYLDYAVALLIQSLMFVRYRHNAIKTIHAWLAACLAATLIDQYISDKTEKRVEKDLY